MRGSILDAVQRPPQLEPGQLTLPDGRALRWNASGLTLTLIDGRTLTLAEGDIAAVQVSRGRTLQPRPPWLGLIPRRHAVVHRLYVDLRPSAAHPEARLRLSAPVDDPARLDGLPWLTGATADVELDALLALVGAARALGGELLAWRPEDEQGPVHGPSRTWHRTSWWVAWSLLVIGAVAAVVSVGFGLAGPGFGFGFHAWLVLGSALWLAFGPVRMTWSGRLQCLTPWHGLLLPARAVDRAQIASIHGDDLPSGGALIALALHDGSSFVIEAVRWQRRPTRRRFDALREALALAPGPIGGDVQRLWRRRWGCDLLRGAAAMVLGLMLSVLAHERLPVAWRAPVEVEDWSVYHDPSPQRSARLHSWWTGLPAQHTGGVRTIHTAGSPHLLAWSPDGSLLASASYHGVVVWDTATAWPVAVNEEVKATRELRFAPEGTHLLVRERRGFRLWEPAAAAWSAPQSVGAPDPTLRWLDNPNAVCWDAGQDRWMALARDTTCGQHGERPLVWLTPVGSAPSTAGDEAVPLDVGEDLCGFHDDLVASVSADCGHVVAVTHASLVLWSRAARWSANSNAPRAVSAHALATPGEVEVVFSDDARWLAIHDHARVQIWALDADAAGQPSTLDADAARSLTCMSTRSSTTRDACTAVALSPAGASVALVVQGRTDVFSLDRSHTHRGVGGRNDTPITAVTFSPDGSVLATGNKDDIVRLFRLE